MCVGAQTGTFEGPKKYLISFKSYDRESESAIPRACQLEIGHFFHRSIPGRWRYSYD
jgi:hypothetical protein